jgi:hypothetical protein
MNTPALTNTKADGLRAVCEPLPDLCHHVDYEIYVDGQYVESAGSLGTSAQRAVEFWQRKRRGKAVEARAGRCRVPGCTWGQQ